MPRGKTEERKTIEKLIKDFGSEANAIFITEFGIRDLRFFLENGNGKQEIHPTGISKGLVWYNENTDLFILGMTEKPPEIDIKINPNELKKCRYVVLVRMLTKEERKKFEDSYTRIAIELLAIKERELPEKTVIFRTVGMPAYFVNLA